MMNPQNIDMPYVESLKRNYEKLKDLQRKIIQTNEYIEQKT